MRVCFLYRFILEFLEFNNVFFVSMSRALNPASEINNELADPIDGESQTFVSRINYCAEVTGTLAAADGPKGVSDQYSHEGKLIAISCMSSGQANAEITENICPTLSCLHEAPIVVDPLRRLTPRECERLQGFAWDYKMIQWRKKAAGNCTDGPRYKALGNSMAVPVMHWIGKRIAEVEANDND
jgi:hypothetical protein